MQNGLAALVALVLVAQATPARAADLAAGSPAPPFTLQGSDGKSYTLEQFKGKEGVVLAWFPKAFTGGCTEELGSLTQDAAAIGAYQAAVFMVSFDSPEKNADFAKSLDSRLVLLSDEKGEVASAYGVSSLGGFYAKRWTFYIDANGAIAAIDKDVKTATAGADIARKLGELGYPKR
jgi:peroxiredoxin Q/BCP